MIPREEPIMTRKEMELEAIARDLAKERGYICDTCGGVQESAPKWAYEAAGHICDCEE